MNWQVFFAYVGSTAAVLTLILGVIGFLFKRWMNKIDENIANVGQGMVDVRVTLAALPGQYLTKEEFQKQKEHDSSKREALWKHYNRISTRTAVIETKIGLDQTYRSKVQDKDDDGGS